MCSDTKQLEILIVLYICSYIMSYDNSNTNLGDTDTAVSCNQSREIHYDLSLGKFDFWLNYSSDILYIVFHSESLMIMKYSEIFLALKDYSYEYYALSCQNAFKISKAIAWVKPEMINATEILSATNAKKIVVSSKTR